MKCQVLFGSGYPTITPERCLSDLEKLDISDELGPLILKENAVELPGLGA